MLTLPGVLSAAIWIMGLAGVLATVSYADWWRSLHRARWSSLWALPRFLSPFCLSFTLFCSGMALAAFTAPSPSWWQITAWSIFALIFAFLTLRWTQAGRQSGWDTPIEGRQP